MLRTALIAAALLGVTTAVFAQADAVTARKQQMGVLSAHAWRAFPMMIKGQIPYEQAKVDAGFAAMLEATKKLPALYPKGTEGAVTAGSNYVASPKIWENRADFDARLAKFEADLGVAKSKATSLEGLKGAFSIVNEGCNSCHGAYRVRN